MSRQDVPNAGQQERASQERIAEGDTDEQKEKCIRLYVLNVVQRPLYLSNQVPGSLFIVRIVTGEGIGRERHMKTYKEMTFDELLKYKERLMGYGRG